MRNANYMQICNNKLCRKFAHTIIDVSIILRINFTNQTLKDDFSFLTMIPVDIRPNFLIDFQRVWQSYEKEKVPGNITNMLLKEKVEYLENFGFNVRSSVLYHSKTKACYVDKYYHSEINYDGKVYKCTARGYDDEYVKGILNDNGSILFMEKEMSEIFSALTCENDLCKNCTFLPICAGPCSQKILESKSIEDICYLKMNELSIDDFIINHYENIHAKKIVSN